MGGGRSSESRGRILSFAAAALFLLAVLFLFLPDRRGVVVIGVGRSAGSVFEDEATLRNVTKGAVAYAIRNPETKTVNIKRRIAAGGMDRIRTATSLTILYDSGVRTEVQVVRPGMPYSFRYDALNLVKLYPGSHGMSDAADLAPYVPTPPPVVRKMLEMAGVGPDDIVYDLGCGDGRIVIAAARDFGARGVGIELDERLIRECREAARLAGVDSRVRFLRLDATKARIKEADVVALYLLPESLEDLEPLFEKELRPGARLVSHDYRVPGWESRLVQSDSAADETGLRHTIYLYRK